MATVEKLYSEDWGTVTLNLSTLASNFSSFEDREAVFVGEEHWLRFVAPHFLEHSNAMKARVAFSTKFPHPTKKHRGSYARTCTDEDFGTLLRNNLSFARLSGVCVKLFNPMELQDLVQCIESSMHPARLTLR